MLLEIGYLFRMSVSKIENLWKCIDIFETNHYSLKETPELRDIQSLFAVLHKNPERESINRNFVRVVES